jgi:antitoxin component YwqK of YwqJK toxin-antitoxin module
MRNLLSATLMCLLLLPANSQTTLSPDSSPMNQTDNKGRKQGYWERKYSNGNLQYKGFFTNDKPVGEFVRYHEGGEVQAIMNFDESGIVAQTVLFYENGEKAAQGRYIETKKDGVWEYFSFYSKGLIARETYDEGVLHGASFTYYDSGNPAQELHWHKGVKHGIWKLYYESGNTKLEGQYFNNMRNGPFTYYYPDGSIDFRGQYLYDLMDGKWDYFDSSGNLVGAVEYVNGKPVNEDELIDKEQELFKLIETSKGKIPEPEESGGFFR